MASYTSHGHHIPGTPIKNPPRQRKICGGPDFCLECEEDTIREFDHRLMLFSNPAGVVSQKVNPLMAETPNTPVDSNINVFNKAVNALHELGHDLGAAEKAVVKLLRSGIVLRDVNEVHGDIQDVDKVVDEAAPVLEAAEPTLAPEVESVQAVADTAAKDSDVVAKDAQEFVNEVAPQNVNLSDVGPR